MALPLLFSLHFFQVLQSTSNFSLHFKIFLPQSQPSGYMELSQNFGACNPFFFLLKFFFRAIAGNQQFETKKHLACGSLGLFLASTFGSPTGHWWQMWVDGSVICKQTGHSWKDGWLGKGKTNETHDGCIKNQRYHKVETFIQTVIFLHNGWSVCWKLMLIFLWLVVSQAAQATMAQYLPKVGKDAGVWVDERMNAFLLCLSFSFLFLP